MIKKILWIGIPLLLLCVAYLTLRSWWILQTSSSGSRTIYHIQTWTRTDVPGEDIFVLDNQWSRILSLEDHTIAQYFHLLYDHFLIVDIGTSASKRTFTLYDLVTQQAIFSSTYYPLQDPTSLQLSWSVLTFFYAYDQTPPPTVAPCTWITNGYVQTRYFDIITQQLTASDIFTCVYFE